ncbi:CCR4-NOT core subunit cdc39, partial [Spiromyces aspiralis]
MYTPADRWSLQQCLSDFSQLMADLDKLVNTISDSVSFNTLPPSHEVFSYAREIVNLALQSLDPEALARDFAQALIQYLYRTKIRLGHELYVRLLLRMCKVSFNVEKEVKYWLIYVEDERKYNEAVTVALIKEGLVPLPEEDMQLARLIDAGRVSAILFAVRLIPRVLRERSLEKSVQDFSNTIAALNRAAQRAPVIPELVRFLKNLAAGTMTVEEEPVDQSVQDTRAALATASTAMSPLPDTPEVAGYRQVLLDWTRVCEHPAAGEKERTMLALQLLSQ